MKFVLIEIGELIKKVLNGIFECMRKRITVVMYVQNEKESRGTRDNILTFYGKASHADASDSSARNE